MQYKQLTNKNIQDFIDELGTSLKQVSMNKHNKLWLNLTLEEVLLKYQEKEAMEGFSYKLKKRFGSLLIELYIKGEQQDMLHPTEGSDVAGDSFLIDNLFNTGDGQVLYRYRNDTNIISISMPTEGLGLKIPGNKMLWAIILGAILGFLLRRLPQDTREFLNASYISPVYSTLMSILKGVSEPVIFTTLVVGICALDDLKIMNKVEKKIILMFLKISTCMFVLACLLCFPVFKSEGAAAISFHFDELLPLLLKSFPTNYVTPFAEGNMIQIVVLGFVTGISILMLGEKARGIKNLMDEAKFLFFCVLEAFVKLLPIAVFLSVVSVFLTITISESAIIWKIIAADIFLDIVFALMILSYTAFRYKIPAKTLLKKSLPMMSVSFATGSSTATIPIFYKRLPENFGVDEKLTSYWIPLSNAFFSPSTIFALIIYAFFAMQMQGKGASISWIIVLYIMIIQIGMATPRIPGGIIASVTILFSQLGLSVDQLGIIMGANVLILYVDTAVASLIRCLGAVALASKEKLIDRDILLH